MARRCFEFLDYLRFRTSVNKRLNVTGMGEQAVIDLTVLSGTYVMVSMLLNATQVGIPGGGAEPLEVLDPIEIRRLGTADDFEPIGSATSGPMVMSALGVQVVWQRCGRRPAARRVCRRPARPPPLGGRWRATAPPLHARWRRVRR
jgi:hypothetical protein